MPAENDSMKHQGAMDDLVYDLHDYENFKFYGFEKGEERDGIQWYGLDKSNEDLIQDVYLGVNADTGETVKIQGERRQNDPSGHSHEGDYTFADSCHDVESYEKMWANMPGYAEKIAEIAGLSDEEIEKAHDAAFDSAYERADAYDEQAREEAEYNDSLTDDDDDYDYDTWEHDEQGDYHDVYGSDEDADDGYDFDLSGRYDQDEVAEIIRKSAEQAVGLAGLMYHEDTSPVTDEEKAMSFLHRKQDPEAMDQYMNADEAGQKALQEQWAKEDRDGKDRAAYEEQWHSARQSSARRDVEQAVDLSKKPSYEHIKVPAGLVKGPFNGKNNQQFDVVSVPFGDSKWGAMSVAEKQLNRGESKSSPVVMALPADRERNVRVKGEDGKTSVEKISPSDLHQMFDKNWKTISASKQREDSRELPDVSETAEASDEKQAGE